MTMSRGRVAAAYCANSSATAEPSLSSRRWSAMSLNHARTKKDVHGAPGCISLNSTSRLDGSTAARSSMSSSTWFDTRASMLVAVEVEASANEVDRARTLAAGNSPR